ELRLMTLVAERTAQHRYRVDQAVVRDDDVVPDRADDLVLADAPVSMRDQINERVESARRQRNRLAAPIEHPLAKIDGEVVELEAGRGRSRHFPHFSVFFCTSSVLPGESSVAVRGPPICGGADPWGRRA